MALIQDQLASSEAAIGRLPPGVRIVQSARDFMVIEIRLSSDPATAQRLCVLFDHDRDLRVLWCVGALVLFNREACTTLIAVAESRGKVQSWWTSTPMLAAVGVRSLQRATDAALAPDDRWDVLPPVFVNTNPHGTADLDSLDADDPLRKTTPKSISLGRVQP
jgi:hypothetical protein